MRKRQKEKERGEKRQKKKWSNKYQDRQKNKILRKNEARK